MLFKADFNHFLSFGSEWQAIKSSSTWPYINIKAKKKKKPDTYTRQSKTCHPSIVFLSTGTTSYIEFDHNLQ